MVPEFVYVILLGNYMLGYGEKKDDKESGG